MISRLFSRLLFAALIVTCGYNFWQVHQLQNEVQALRRPALRTRFIATPLRGAEQADWLVQADTHAHRAAEALAHADIVGAQRELSRGADDVARAAQSREASTVATAVEMRREINVLKARLARLQAQAKTVSEAAKPQVKHIRAQVEALQVQVEALWRMKSLARSVRRPDDKS